MRPSLSPRHRSLELVVLNPEIDGIGHELEVLTECVPGGRCHDALDLTVTGVNVDHSSRQREAAAASPLYRWFTHQAREVMRAVKKS